MSYRFLEETAIADIAFEAEGKTLRELFQSAALAVTATMVGDVESIEPKVTKRFSGEAENIDMLLFSFLQDLIFYKDAELLLFSRFEPEISRKGDLWHLKVKAAGEEIDPEKHDLIVDVKAVSLHNYKVERSAEGWLAEVILDV